MIRNVFIDTNIYEENNFFHTTNIQSLFYYSKIGIINLYMTNISKLEFINRMKKGIIELKEDHNKLVNFINKTRILRNLSSYEKFDKSKISIEESITELTKKLNFIIKNAKIKIISSENTSIDEVFDLFYKNEPPFCFGAKKNEFPDAFILKSIESWCKINKKKILFVTKDHDFKGYKNSRIEFKNDLPKLLYDISEYFDSQQKTKIIPLIKSTLIKYQEEILNEIDTQINTLIKFDTDYEKTSELNRSKVRYIDFLISSIRPDFAEIIYNVEFDYSFTIFPTELDYYHSSFADIIKPILYSGNKKISCDLQLNFKKDNDVKVKWINSNQKIIINDNV